MVDRLVSSTNNPVRFAGLDPFSDSLNDVGVTLGGMASAGDPAKRD